LICEMSLEKKESSMPKTIEHLNNFLSSLITNV
jgi:hypothetical protein